MSQVSLRRMTADEFDTWASDVTETFAIDLSVATGTPRDVALAQANEQFPHLLPNGVDTADTWVMVIEDTTGNRVGTIWIGPHPTNESSAFVWDIKIDEPRQGQGLGRAAMLEAEGLAGNAGRSEIGLNVFGFNERAQELYTSLGYRVVSTAMAKDLPKPS